MSEFSENCDMVYGTHGKYSSWSCLSRVCCGSVWQKFESAQQILVEVSHIQENFLRCRAVHSSALQDNLCAAGCKWDLVFK
jgi:hypothetical protein